MNRSDIKKQVKIIRTESGFKTITMQTIEETYHGITEDDC